MPGPHRTTTRLLRCGTCGRVKACSQAELLRFTRQGWPTCCGEVMAVVTEAPPSDDTRPEHKPLPPA